ncbi:phage recombination protein Bet [Halomonas sp. 86]|uniref:phage recombination protein Bet n=1 Tax=unclassified Halomonas TaxID=2609666 RepID=UPI0040345527
MTASTQTASAASSFVVQMSERYGIDQDKLMDTLRKTAFKQQDKREITHEQMAAMMVVCNEFKLNPFIKEIYAFPDKTGGIIPVVSVDGWVSLVNRQPTYEGVEFVYSDRYVHMENARSPAPDWIECWIHRSDLAKPVKIREFLDETYRYTGSIRPWQTHPKRMLRHKALIQCARIAFGLHGIYDEDEAERIISPEQGNGDDINTLHAPLSVEVKTQLDEVLTQLVEQCRSKGSFAPGREWINSQPDAAAREYLSEQLANAEAQSSTLVSDSEQLPEQSVSSHTNAHVTQNALAQRSSAPSADTKASSSDEVTEKLKTATAELISACRHQGDYSLGYKWVESRLSNPVQQQYVRDALDIAQGEDQKLQSAA